MGRPPSNGGPSFRFTSSEVSEMEAILQQHNNTMPAREILVGLAEKFSESAERKGKVTVQMKQVWNWFQNRRYAVRSKSTKSPAKLNVSTLPRADLTAARNVPQPMTTPIAAAAAAASVTDTGRVAPEISVMEFEAKSGRDGAWYDVSVFLSHRHLESADPEVLIRFSGFGSEEDEWVNVKKHIRPRSLPCESSECVVVLPGDLILCFQEGKEQALYYDAHVLDAQRRRHDVRGCRCRFLVRYDHDQSEEIVPLRKVCRRPETDYRLQQLHAEQHKNSLEIFTVNAVRKAAPVETVQKPHNVHITSTAPVLQANVSVENQASTPELKQADTSPVINTGNANVTPASDASDEAGRGMVPGGTSEPRSENKPVVVG